MDKIEARSILEEELSRWRQRSYSELLSLVDEPDTVERVAPSGVTYQIEMQVFFDDKSRRNLRVMGAIDDTSWRYTLSPLSSDFIVAPDGSFVGE